MPRITRAAALLTLTAFVVTVVVSTTDLHGESISESVPTSRSPELVVVATRNATPSFDLPFATDVVDGMRFDDAMFRSTPDALRELSGVMVQKTSPGQGSPYIRGFTGFRTLLLIDGIRLNNSIFREGPNQYWSTVDPYSVDRFEVLKGPGSVLYGSDGIGGVVNAMSKNPTGYGEGLNFYARNFYRVASAERSHIGRTEFGVTYDNLFGIQFGATGKWFGDVEGGDDIGRQEGTGFDEWDADLKAEYFLDTNTRLVFGYQRVQQNNVPRTHSTIDGISFAGTTIGSDLQRDLDQDRELLYLQLHAEKLEGFINTARFSISWHEQRQLEDRIRTTRRDIDGVSVGTLGLWTQFESESPIGRWTYGLEYYHDNVNSSSRRDGVTDSVQGPVGDDASYDLLGLFVQNTISLHESIDLVLGGRYTYAHAKAKKVENPTTKATYSIDEDYDSFVGSGRVLFHVAPEKWNLYAGVSQGFRAPNLSDLTSTVEARTNEIEIPSSGLSPEYFTSFEVGSKLRLENLSIDAAYFYTIVDDMLVRSPTGDTDGMGNIFVTRLNSGDGFVHGIELSARWQWHPQWSLFGNLSWQEGEAAAFPVAGSMTKVDEPISRLMPLSGLIGLRWDSLSGRYFVEGVVALADKADKLSSGDRGDTQRIPPGGTPGYAVVHLRSGWRINENVRLTAAIENLLDHDYRVHGSGTNEPGRNFILGMDISF